MGNQHVLYMICVILLNIAFIMNGYLSPVGMISIILVGVIHVRDSVYVLIRLLFNPFVQKKDKGGDPSGATNILCALPTYKEDIQDVAMTLDSLIGQQEKGSVTKRIIMICDGHFTYSDIFSSMVLIDAIQYETFRKKLSTFNVFRAIYKSKDVVILVKGENCGKKDSLILIDKIFVHNDFKQLRVDLLNVFKISHFNYIFHTDADTHVEENTLFEASRILSLNADVSAVAGFIMVSKHFHFWSLYQGFEYYYEQLIGRLSESYWGKPFILPGCIYMVNITHSCVVQGSKEFQKLPSRNNIFEINDRMQGTDRRYTNCLLQHSPHVRLLVSSELSCFTKPPQSLRHFVSQRNRWMSNAISGYLFLLIGENSSWYVRLLALLELFHIHTSVARLYCSLAILIHITQLAHVALVSMRALMLIPFVFFMAHAIRLHSYGWFLLIGCFLSMFVSPFLNVYVFVNCLVNFTSISWGMSHGNLETTRNSRLRN